MTFESMPDDWSRVVFHVANKLLTFKARCVAFIIIF